MEKKSVSCVMLTLLLTSMLTLAFNIQTVRASGTIHIRADGSVEGTDKIQRDGDVYTLTDNIYDSIVVERDNIVIDGAGYTLQGTGAYESKGIDLAGRNNVTIKNTEIGAFDYGIFLHSSSNNSILGNNITDNLWCGIWLYDSSNNIIAGNNMTGWYGFRLYDSSNNTIAGNNITGYWAGVWCYCSSNNVFRGNSACARSDFFVWGETLSDFVNDVDTSNTVHGKPIYYWVGKQDMTVPTDAGCVVLLNSKNITVQNLNLQNNRVLLANTTNSKIANNDINGNFNEGLCLYESPNCTICENNITENAPDWIGFILERSPNCAIYRNNITESETGLSLRDSPNCTITENNITNNVYGALELFASSNCNITGNNITNGMSGLRLYNSSCCNVYENDIVSHFFGLTLHRSSNNMFYHNNFVSNTHQVNSYESVNVWDDGYPSGGSYWSDYSARYPDAQELDDSGIWDTPYVVDGSNQDNYPLIEPWTPTSPTVMASLDIAADTLNLRSIGQWITAYIQLPEGYDAEDIDATTILLNGVIQPVLDPEYDFATNSSEYLVDHNNDGVLERMVKFDRATVLELILASDITNGYAILTITGEVDGTSFEGEDTIRVFLGGGGSGRRK